MSDKLAKVRAEIESLRKEVKDNITELGTSESERIGLFNDLEIYDNILSFIDSMQEEPNITGISSKQATGKLKECIDNITEESLAKSRKQMEENPKECMYARDNYTDEDRKVLCDGCEEECKFKPTTSVWHSASERPKPDGELTEEFYRKKILVVTKDYVLIHFTKNYRNLVNVVKWAYIDDLLKL